MVQFNNGKSLCSRKSNCFNQNDKESFFPYKRKWMLQHIQRIRETAKYMEFLHMHVSSGHGKYISIIRIMTQDFLTPVEGVTNPGKKQGFLLWERKKTPNRLNNKQPIVQTYERKSETSGLSQEYDLSSCRIWVMRSGPTLVFACVKLCSLRQERISVPLAGAGAAEGSPQPSLKCCGSWTVVNEGLQNYPQCCE